MNGDARGWRIALVPDALINPRTLGRTALPDVLGVLEAGGYGVLQLPPPGRHGLLLAVIADQVAEYAHHGYAVVAIGVRGEPGGGLHWRRLAPLLRHRGVAPPPRHLIRAGRRRRGRGAAVRRCSCPATICRWRSNVAGAARRGLRSSHQSLLLGVMPRFRRRCSGGFRHGRLLGGTSRVYRGVRRCLCDFNSGSIAG